MSAGYDLSRAACLPPGRVRDFLIKQGLAKLEAASPAPRPGDADYIPRMLAIANEKDRRNGR
jgi:hypothetical protein